MTEISLRTHQQEAIEAITTCFEENDSCLVKMFCGTGKTRIVFYLMMNSKNNLSIIVFPSLALIEQFNIDYINSPEWLELTKKFKYMSVCSASECLDSTHKIHYTTDKERISNFLEGDKRKILSVTYQSFETLSECIKDSSVGIDLLIYDEAHHVVGSTIQKFVFQDEDFEELTDKRIFLTATPKNSNGIIMLDREDESDCGTLAYEYTHRQAVKDNICNDFTIGVHFGCPEKLKQSCIYEAITRSMLSTGNMRMLTFHSYSECEKDGASNVLSFTSEKKALTSAYKKLRETEFSEHKKTKLQMKGITASTKGKLKKVKNFF